MPTVNCMHGYPIDEVCPQCPGLVRSPQEQRIAALEAELAEARKQVLAAHGEARDAASAWLVDHRPLGKTAYWTLGNVAAFGQAYARRAEVERDALRERLEAARVSLRDHHDQESCIGCGCYCASLEEIIDQRNRMRTGMRKRLERAEADGSFCFGMGHGTGCMYVTVLAERADPEDLEAAKAAAAKQRRRDRAASAQGGE